MCTKIEKFDRLAGIMMCRTLRPGCDFIDYCLKIHASPDSMDRLFRDRLGLSGDEFLRILLK